MWISTAQVLVTLGLAYLALGLLFALAFVVRGVSRIDPATETGPWTFRLLLVPGCAAFWPLLLRRWVAGSPPPEEASAHRRLAGTGTDTGTGDPAAEEPS